MNKFAIVIGSIIIIATLRVAAIQEKSLLFKVLMSTPVAAMVGVFSVIEAKRM